MSKSRTTVSKERKTVSKERKTVSKERKTISLKQAEKALLGKKLSFCKFSKSEDNEIKHMRIDTVEKAKDGFKVGQKIGKSKTSNMSKTVFVGNETLSFLIKYGMWADADPKINKRELFYLTEESDDIEAIRDEVAKLLEGLYTIDRLEGREQTIFDVLKTALPPEISDHIHIKDKEAVDGEEANERKKIDEYKKSLVGRTVHVTKEVDGEEFWSNIRLDKITEEEDGGIGIKQFDKDGNVEASAVITASMLLSIGKGHSCRVPFPSENNTYLTFTLEEDIIF